MEIRRTYNPLTLHHDMVYRGLDLSPNQVIERENLIFPRPVVLLVNGEPRLRQDWDDVLGPDDICHFVEIPGLSGLWAAVVWIAEAVAYAAIGYGVGYLLNQWFGADVRPPATPEISTRPSHTLSGGRNELKIGAPYSEHFGRFICFPDLIQRNYAEYASHFNQYLYMIGVIGVGEYDIEGVYIDKTPLTDYAEASYNIIPPSGTPTLVPRVVYTSSAISGQELSTDWLTVAISAPGTEITEIGFDIIFPSGLVEFNDDGEKKNEKVTVQAEIRKIDDAGVAITAWAQLMGKKFKQDETNPLHYTQSYPAFGQARYEFRVKRTNSRSYEAKKIDNCIIEALRGYGPEHPDYGDVTLIECKIKATEKLNGDISQRINVVCTRKLYPVTATGFGVTKAATRCIVDACAYIVTADNGGQQASSILEFEELYTLKGVLAGRSNYFDYRFVNKGMALEACIQIAKCGRAIPIMPGGLFTLVRDKIQTTPTQIYTDDDYNPDSLDFNHAFRTDDDSTCVEIEYIDSDTWQNEMVQCVDVGGGYDNPIRIRLDGCTDRQHAFEEGMYAYLDDELNRTAVSFVTGLKGLIPQTGDMIYVASRQTDWGQTGQIAHATATKAWLSEPVDFGEAAEGKLLVVNQSGGTLGPYTVTPGDCAHSVTAALPLGSIYTQHTDGDKASKFLFGESVDDMLRVRTLKVIPASNNEVRVVGSIINDAVHDDPGTAPGATPHDVDLPILDNLTVEYEDYTDPNYEYNSNWLSSEDKFKLEIDIGAGYVLLVDNLEAYAYAFTSTSIDFTLKVTPYIDGVLTPGEAKTKAFELPAAPTGLNVTDDNVDVTATWTAVTGADSYEVRVEDSLNDTVWTETAETNEIVFKVSQVCDWVNSVYPSVYVYVATRIGELVGPESSQYAWQLDPPPAPASLSAVSYEEGDTWVCLIWSNVNVDNGQGGNLVTGYVIYKDASPTFDPALGQGTVCRTTAGITTIIYDISIGATPIYFRVAAYTDSSANFDSLNFCSALKVSAGEIPAGDLLDAF